MLLKVRWNCKYALALHHLSFIYCIFLSGFKATQKKLPYNHCWVTKMLKDSKRCVNLVLKWTTNAVNVRGLIAAPGFVITAVSAFKDVVILEEQTQETKTGLYALTLLTSGTAGSDPPPRTERQSFSQYLQAGTGRAVKHNVKIHKRALKTCNTTAPSWRAYLSFNLIF